MIDIEELEALAKSVGGEKWSTETGQGTFVGMHVWHEDGDAVCRVFTNLGHMPEPIMEEDLAQYIAAANPAAILALIAEVRALRTRLEIDPRHSYDGIYCRDETIGQLEDEVRALRADAARYQWIRDPNNSWGPIFAEPITWNGGAWARLGSRYVYQHLDQAIDAARDGK